MGTSHICFTWLNFVGVAVIFNAHFVIVMSFIVVNIFLGSTLPAFHLDDSGVYVMIVYLLGLAAVVLFDIYLTCSQTKDLSNYCVLSKPQDDEVELAPLPRRTQSDREMVRCTLQSLSSIRV